MFVMLTQTWHTAMEAEVAMAMSEGEIARRQRIGAKNLGKIPWNKGLGEVWPAHLSC